MAFPQHNLLKKNVIRTPTVIFSELYNLSPIQIMYLYLWCIVCSSIYLLLICILCSEISDMNRLYDMMIMDKYAKSVENETFSVRPWIHCTAAHCVHYYHPISKWRVDKSNIRLDLSPVHRLKHSLLNQYNVRIRLETKEVHGN